MLRVKIQETNGEFEKEFNLNTTKSDFYYNKIPNTSYVLPNFSYKSLLDQLNISVDILKPYNDGEDFIFLYASNVWEKLKIPNDFIVSKRFKLIVCDNGIGLPHDLDINSTKSLGMTILQSLTKQIDGELINLKPDKGTAIMIKFPI